MLNEKLNNYKAKGNNQSIKSHDDELLIILNQFKEIYNIENKTYLKLLNICEIHDIGKAHFEFQNDITSKNRKVRHELLSASYLNITYNERIAILLHHRDIRTLNKTMLKANKYYDEFRKDLEKELNIETLDIRDILYKLDRSTLCDELKDKELIFLKGYLQLCDHLASAGVKKIEGKINTNELYNYPKLSSIQIKIKNIKVGKDVIIQAMTGLGKTSTAMYWSDLIQNEHKNKRIYYILPYTASINAKYHEFNDLNVSTAMLHGKAQYFLNKEMDDAEECRSKYQLFKKSVKQVTVCTIYQLFKSIFSCKNFEMLLCQMNNSIFIIDEIHCFDTKQLALILTTLKYLKKNYGIGICIMSASIPTCLLNVIEEELDINTVIVADSIDLIERHHINYYDSYLISNLNMIRNDLKDGKQVLICVNNVKLSQQLYDEFKDYKSLRLVHGKFNTRDREQAEVDLYKQRILIGTQAIEVSLDISYDIIYTEIAPWDALLQRFGRVNRKGEKGVSEVHIFKNSNEKIYNLDIIIKTKYVIDEIIEKDNGIIKEEKVNYYLDKVYSDINRADYEIRKNQINQIIENLRVGVYNQDSDMIEKSSLQVLPSILSNEYNIFIENKDYMSANSLFVNISDAQFAYQCRSGIIYKNEKDIYITNCRYTKEKGLEYEIDLEEKFG
ncbi:CRISPR-associated helicase Cas3' [Clostridium estertheticum]|uniref:CRISPR-associated helicase Cas3' n=1 Tax=Clostridium estertheticum TaxID=238834 RepID=UPI001C0DBB69|nr:CRISPR-associated helicase Cas3' [Clostridium estertheticum]MBU3174301.1 CRISPR-associated helicase Cas3' [Clostridium estertheticum]